MGKLHELLAVDSTLQAAAQKTLASARGLFTQGKRAFLGSDKRYVSTRDVVGPEPQPEVTGVSITVGAALDDVELTYGRWMDAQVQKEVANTKATAKPDIAGLPEMPATALLNLENKLRELIALYKEVPVNDPGVNWDFNADTGLYQSEPVKRNTTKKVRMKDVLYEATKDHPAQVEVYHVDQVVGQTVTTAFSGMLSPVDLAGRQARANELLIEVKKARQRANEQEVLPTQVAGKIFRFING